MDSEHPDKTPADALGTEATQLLRRWSDGDNGALEELMPLVYSELEKLASSYLRRERGGHTLQTGALVNEAYLRLIGYEKVDFNTRAHFMATAAVVMRRVLVDHARRNAAGKRFSAADRVELGDAHVVVDAEDVDVLALHDALEKLHEIDERKARVVELRYFGGLNQEETAAVLDISVPTVVRDWRVARMTLRRWLNTPDD